MRTMPPAAATAETGPRYWRSLDELAETPEFRAWVEREFPAGASEFTDPVSRRHFVKIMSASFLLAGLGLTGCRRPVEKIVPFSKMPENYLHGVPRHYATAMPLREGALPLVVKSHEGRPVKIEGNAEHPVNQLEDAGGRPHGGTDLLAQASLLSLYDPDRAQRFTRGGQNVTREAALDFLAETGQRHEGVQGRGLCFLLEHSSSPTRARLQKLISAKLPQARWFAYEPVDFQVHRQAATLAYGQPVQPCFQLEKAKRILSLDCDFLGTEPDACRLIRGFARGRRLAAGGEEMSRLYVAEGLCTVTGANADHRLRMPASSVFPLACALFAELMTQAKADQNDPQAAAFLEALRGLAAASKADPQWVRECVRDLANHPGETVVLAGHRQPLPVHLLAQAFNFYLGAVGKTLVLQAAPATTTGSLGDLAKALRAGEVETLVVLGGNPVYNAPADLDWAKTQRQAKTVIRLGAYEDETFAACDWHLPQAHYLESWGDARTADGTLTPVQPLVEPLFGGLSELEVLEVLARRGGQTRSNPYELVRETLRELAPEGVFEENWKKFLHDGYLANSAAKPVEARFNWAAVGPAVVASPTVAAPTAQSLEVVFSRDYRVDDGRYNNNGWLQELPDPVTKITWDNLILLSPRTAIELGVVVRDENKLNLTVPVVRVEVAGRAIEGPAWVQPGLADHLVGVTLGYGRGQTGRVGRGSGYNAYPLRTASAAHLASGAKLTLTGKTYPLSSTQNHWSMEGRPIVREANLEAFQKNPRFAEGFNLEEPPVAKPLYPNPLEVPNAQGVTPKQDATHWWGMAIDLNMCVGCSACVVACQSENNVPIVGKDQVNRNREMHWLRIDRYYSGPVADPQVIHQPMMCQHCEAAPCESVCPVNATVHDAEGLNLMVYNRCVGTRYCSNNCPYKVRRFNFFDYNRRPLDQLYRSPLTSFNEGEWEMKRWFKDPDRGSRPQDEWDLLKLARNPEVTVRMRGVMEKCTFCLQRLEQAKIAQKVKAGASGDVQVREGALQTACQQACPAEAIVFGNLKDPDSAVSQARQDGRSYSVLEFLATKPRVTYLARVRNPNPAMPDYRSLPASTQEFLDHHGTLEDHHYQHGQEGAEGQAVTPKKGAH